MTCPTAVSANYSPSITTNHLSSRAAFYLLSSITVSFLAGSSAPTPLYPIYQAEWGFAPVTVTVVFGIYALAVLIALLAIGRLSDHIGRRPVLIVATLAQAVTMLVFATADGLFGLLIARIIQGLSTGAAIAAVGAAILDLDKARGTIANAVAPPIGTALGAIVAGFMVHYLPAPTHLIYWMLAAIFVMQAIGVAFVAESIAPHSGALASLKPQFSLPIAVRQPMLFVVPALVGTWALAGFYASLGPSLVHSILGLNASMLGGVALSVLAGSAGLAVLLMQRHQIRTLMLFGSSVLIVGISLVITALSFHSAAAFFLGTAIAGMGFGTGFQGAVRTVVPLVAPTERAGVLSVIFVIAYLAMGLPAIVAGYLVSQGGNIFVTAREFGAAIIVLAACALLGTISNHFKDKSILRSKRQYGNY